ncbi:MAG: hypothetical protein ACI81T_000776 [Bacteroidia bacterium]|jgi:hypothetical protein
MGKELLLKNLYKQLRATILETSRAYGYGMIVNDLQMKNETVTKKGKLIGHGGDTEAFHGDYKYIPELGIDAVILTNTNSGVYARSAWQLLKLDVKETQNLDLSVKYETSEKRFSEHQENERLGIYNFADCYSLLCYPKSNSYSIDNQ